MADKAIIKTETLTGIGNAIRNAGMADALLSPAEMKQTLEGVSKRSASDLAISGAQLTVPKGYYPEAVSRSVGTTGLGTPVITVDANGKITSSVTHTASGYVEAGTKTATRQLTTQAGKTVTPTEEEQTAVKAGSYVTGDIKVAAAAAGGELIENVAVDGSSGTYTVTVKKQINSIQKIMLAFHSGDGSAIFMLYGEGTSLTQAYRVSNAYNVGTISVTISGKTISWSNQMLAGALTKDTFAYGAIWYT